MNRPETALLCSIYEALARTLSSALSPSASSSTSAGAFFAVDIPAIIALLTAMFDLLRIPAVFACLETVVLRARGASRNFFCYVWTCHSLVYAERVTDIDIANASFILTGALGSLFHFRGMSDDPRRTNNDVAAKAEEICLRAIMALDRPDADTQGNAPPASTAGAAAGGKGAAGAKGEGRALLLRSRCPKNG